MNSPTKWHTGKSLGEPDYLKDLIRRFVTRRRVCVQAGGHRGAWPRYLSRWFETVITLEPFHENFADLVADCPENVYPIRAGLWNHSRRTSFVMRGKNKKKGHVERGVPSGIVPLVTLDGICPAEIDFICLDVEGAEVEALRGGRAILEMSHPVVAVEINVNRLRKGEENYRTSVDRVLTVLPDGYREVETYGIDRVFVYGE